VSYVHCLGRLGRAAARTALLPGVALMLALAVATPAAAQDNWCVQLTNESGALRCGFATFEQCSAARGYGGGFCITSPYSGSGAPSATRPRPRRTR
jgi:Protein of unknown function (DUF3551)